MKGREAFYPIVYGNISYPVAKRNEKTSNWIVFVRGQNLEDLSFLIEKVVFFLHPSFEERIRQVTKPPFEVKESGWGSFEVLIQIWLRSGQSVELKHILKLYHLHSPSGQSKKPLVSQAYDEVVYVNPPQKVLQILSNAPAGAGHGQEEGQEVDESQLRSYLQFTKYLTRFQARQEENRLRECIKYIQWQSRQLQERIAGLQGELQRGYEQSCK